MKIIILFISFQSGVAVEIVRVLPESPPPTLSNIYCNSEDTHPSEMVSEH